MFVLLLTFCLYGRYNGPITPDSPSWKHQTYIVHTRNALALVKHMAANPEFDGKWDYSPFEEFTASGERRWSDFMSGHWSWKEAVSHALHLYVETVLTCFPGHHRA